MERLKNSNKKLPNHPTNQPIWHRKIQSGEKKRRGGIRNEFLFGSGGKRREKKVGKGTKFKNSANDED